MEWSFNLTPQQVAVLSEKKGKREVSERPFLSLTHAGCVMHRHSCFVGVSFEKKVKNEDSAFFFLLIVCSERLFSLSWFFFFKEEERKGKGGG